MQVHCFKTILENINNWLRDYAKKKRAKIANKEKVHVIIPQTKKDGVNYYTICKNI